VAHKKIHIFAFIIAALLLTISGCQTYQGQLSELGTETGEATVVGRSTYIGWYGLSTKEKHEVYEDALRNALQATNATELKDTKLWIKNYTGPHTLLALAPAVIASFVWDADLAALIISTASLVIGGLEIDQFIVTGIPE